MTSVYKYIYKHIYMPALFQNNLVAKDNRYVAGLIIICRNTTIQKHKNNMSENV